MVLTGNKARAAISAQGEVKGAYIALKDVRAELSKAKKAGKGGEVSTVIIQDPRTGKNVEAVRRDEVKSAGVKVKEPKPQGHEAQQRRHDEERKKAQAKAAALTREYSAILGAVRQAAAGAALPTFAVQLITSAALAGVDYDDQPLLATLHGFKHYDALRKAVGQMPADKCTTLLLDCALVCGVTVNPWHVEQKPEALLQAAKHWDVDVAQIKADVAEIPVDNVTQDLLQEPAGANVDEEQREEEEAQA